MKNIITFLVIVFCGSSYAQYTKIFDFAGANGKYPVSSLISDGSYFYGMTMEGGISDSGTVFKIKSDGSGFVKLFDFSGALNGSYPKGSLISDGTFLYGMTYSGGTNNNGVIFKIKPDGTGFSKLLDFSGVNGRFPFGSLFCNGNFLYGMTCGGGTYPDNLYNGSGVLFRINKDGTGDTVLLNFNHTNGQNPAGSLITDGTFLYGMTSQGGTGPCGDGCGVVFKIMPDGTGYSKLLDFSNSSGAWPLGSFFYDDIFLYGVTQDGGANAGIIFRIKPDGSSDSTLFSFTGGPTLGAYPLGSLITDGTFLYGTTYDGGANFAGTIFKITKDGSGYSTLFDNFTYAEGSHPCSSLISDGNFLYGMTSEGGVNNSGTIFKYCLTTVGEEEPIINNIHLIIYPNPTSDILTIEASQNITIEILNINGQIIKAIYNRGKKTKIDLESLSCGVYIIKVKTDTEIVAKKFVKSKKQVQQ